MKWRCNIINPIIYLSIIKEIINLLVFSQCYMYENWRIRTRIKNWYDNFFVERHWHLLQLLLHRNLAMKTQQRTFWCCRKEIVGGKNQDVNRSNDFNEHESVMPLGLPVGSLQNENNLLIRLKTDQLGSRRHSDSQVNEENHRVSSRKMKERWDNGVHAFLFGWKGCI